MAETSIIKTTCGVCGSGCPADAYVKDGTLLYTEGSRGHAADSGKLCVKGLSARQFLYHEDRILYPMKRTGTKRDGTFERISWEEAYDIIATRLLDIRRRYGAKSTVFYAGHPKWFRPALLRLSNAYGSPNFCTESSTCFQAAAIAWRSIYGNAICGPDLKHTKTLLVWSSNLYHTKPTRSKLYQELQKKGVTIIVVDSRHTVTAHEATVHLQPEAGTDGALALSMAYVIIKEQLYDKDFVSRYVYGFEEYREYVNQFPPGRAEEITKVPAELIRQAALLFAKNRPSGILFSASPIVHHVNGVQNYRAVFALSAITGNYDVEGGNCPTAGISSPYNEYGKIKRFRKEEALGEKEFPVWFDLPCEEAHCTRLADYIIEENPYPIKAIFAMGLNHRMWPQPGHLQKALEKLDFYVNTELFLSDSSAAADLILPACTSFEREEVHVLPGGRFLFSNQAVAPLGEAKNDIEIIMEVLKKMQLQDGILEKGYEKYMQHIIEPSGLNLEELRNRPEGLAGNVLQPASFKNYEHTPFPTPSGKIELKSQILERYKESHHYEGLPVFHDFRRRKDIDRLRFPLVLSTGCRKPQYFHARINRLSWLKNLEEAVLIEMHPKDGEKYKITEGDTVRITSPAGKVSGIAFYNVSGRPGTVYMYHGNAKGEANELIDKDYLDPISGFPGYKSYFCRIDKQEGE